MVTQDMTHCEYDTVGFTGQDYFSTVFRRYLTKAREKPSQSDAWREARGCSRFALAKRSRKGHTLTYP